MGQTQKTPFLSQVAESVSFTRLSLASVQVAVTDVVTFVGNRGGSCLFLTLVRTVAWSVKFFSRISTVVLVLVVTLQTVFSARSLPVLSISVMLPKEKFWQQVVKTAPRQMVKSMSRPCWRERAAGIERQG